MSLGDDLRRSATEADESAKEIDRLTERVSDLEDDLRQAEKGADRLRDELEKVLEPHTRRAWTFVMRNDREALYKHMAAMNGADEAIAILKAAAGDV